MLDSQKYCQFDENVKMSRKIGVLYDAGLSKRCHRFEIIASDN